MTEKMHIDLYPENGCALLGTILDGQKCLDLRNSIDQARPVNKEIFYSSKQDFEKNGRWTNYAPGRTDHNYLIDQKVNLDFIEQNPAFVEALTKLCGENYEVFKKAIIRSMPHWAIPEWCFEYIDDVGRPNMNPFIRDEFQDVQYFYTTDFHQDKTRPESDFVTVYVYLDQVDASCSALKLMTKSHVLGMTHYPHSIRSSKLDKDRLFYNDMLGNSQECRLVPVTGDAGSVAVFHCMTLHGTGHNNNKNPRISIRYLIKKGSAERNGCLHDLANDKIIGPKALSPTRMDVSAGEGFRKTGSSLSSLGLD